MGKRAKKDPPVVLNSSALTHSPFAGLAAAVKEVSSVPPPAPAPPEGPPEGDSPLRFPDKIILRRETKGRAGKTVTRLSGIPSSHLTEVARRLRKSLGCGAVVEADDVVLLGAVEERAWSWLLAHGATRLAKGTHPGPQSNQTPRPPTPERSSGPAREGTIRANVRRGLEVAIVLKAHQSTGELTTGVVHDVLTKAPQHPRGIKVRLESGQVGRVQRIL